MQRSSNVDIRNSDVDSYDLFCLCNHLPFALSLHGISSGSSIICIFCPQVLRSQSCVSYQQLSMHFKSLEVFPRTY